jgi:WD40 repeat protein
MSLQHLALVLIASLPPPILDGLRRDDPDYERFLGRWKVVAMTSAGKDRPDRPLALEFTRREVVPEIPGGLGFLGFLATVEAADAKPTAWMYALKSNAPRPQIYLTQFHKKADLLGPLLRIGVPSVTQGTYEFRQDELTLFLAEEEAELPRDLDPKGRGITVLKLRRERPGGVAPIPDVVLELVADRDQKMVFTGRTTGTLQVWSVPQAKELARWPGHVARLTSLAVSHNFQRGLSADMTGRICFWDLNRHELIHAWQVPANVHAPVATLSGDGRWAYVAQGRDVVEADAATGVERRRFRVATPPATCVTVSPDGGSVLLGDASGTLWQYPLKQGEPADGTAVFALPKGGVFLRLRPADRGGTVCCTGLERHQAELPMFAKVIMGPLSLGAVWPFLTPKFEPTFLAPFALRIQPMTGRVERVNLPGDVLSNEAIQGESYDVSSDGRGLVLFGQRSLWLLREPFHEVLNSRDDQAGGPRLKLLAQHEAAPARAWLVGNDVVVSRLDGALERFDLTSPARPRRVELPNQFTIQGNTSAENLAFSSTGKFLLASGLTTGAGVWNSTGSFWGLCQLDRQRVTRRYQFTAQGDGVYGVYDQDEYDPVRRQRRPERGLVRWPIPKARQLQPLPPAWRSAPLQDFHPVGVYAVLPDQQRVLGLKADLAGGQDGVALWDAKTGRILRRFGDGSVQVNNIAITPEGTRALVQEQGSAAVYVWDLATGRRLHVLPASKGQSPLPGMGWTSRGDLVTCSGYSLQASDQPGGRIYLWNVQTGEQARIFPVAHQAHFAVASQADLVVTTGSDGMRVWDVRTGALRTTLLEPQLRGPVAVMADGQLAAVAFGRDLWLVNLSQPLPPGRIFAPLVAQAER